MRACHKVLLATIVDLRHRVDAGVMGEIHQRALEEHRARRAAQPTPGRRTHLALALFAQASRGLTNVQLPNVSCHVGATEAEMTDAGASPVGEGARRLALRARAAR